MKANGVSGAMDQGESVQGTVAAHVNLEDEGEGDGGPTYMRSSDRTLLVFTGSGNGETRGTASTSSRTRAANIVRCQGQGTSSTAKRVRLDMDFMDTLNRMSESIETIEKMGIEAALSKHKDNLLDRQKNRRIELKMSKMQQT